MRWIAVLGFLALALAACSGGASSPVSLTFEGATPTPLTSTQASPESEASTPIAEETAPPADGVVRVVATGDVMLDRAPGAAIDRFGTGYPLELVRDTLLEGDITVVNLEMALTDRGSAANKDFVFRGPTYYADALTSAGVDLAVLANNHAMDYGPVGLVDTLDALELRGIPTVGAGRNAEEAYRPVVVERNGLKVAFVAFVNVPDDSLSGFVARSMEASGEMPGVAWLTEETLLAGIEAAKAVGDHVVVVMHTGFEYQDAPNDFQVYLSRLAIDRGASLVIGHHPHVLQGFERYGGGAVAYSLGNFVFDRDEYDLAAIGDGPQPTAVLLATLTRAGLEDAELLPFVVDPLEHRPRPARDEAEAALVRDHIDYVNSLVP